jgi:hypothetical protein
VVGNFDIVTFLKLAPTSKVTEWVTYTFDGAKYYTFKINEPVS